METIVKTPEDLYKGQKSILVLIIGASGTGKSTSFISLDPKETFLINVMGKALPFQSGFIDYQQGTNMLVAADATNIISQMKMFESLTYKPDVKNLIVDDLQYIMATEFMNKISQKGYDKWNAIANNVWTILVTASKLRGGLKVFVTAHDESSEGEKKMKTLGKLLDDKLTPEGLSTIVLWSKVTYKEGANTYSFQTQNDGVACAKSPLGMFPSMIPNNLDLVSKRIDEYYSQVKLEDSKLKFDDLTIKKGG